MIQYSCEEQSEEFRIFLIKTAILQRRIGEDIIVRAEEKGGFWAGMIRCISIEGSKCPYGRDSCVLFKSSYIFETESEANIWINGILKEIKESINHQDVVRFLKLRREVRNEH